MGNAEGCQRFVMSRRFEEAEPSRLPLEVLVVDDEAEVRDLLVEYFRALHMPVDAAADGLAAVALLRRHPGRFGLVIADLQLPGVDGLAVLGEARRTSPGCHVVIVTGYASLDSAIQAVRLGAYDYLTKPFTLGQLDVILARLRDRLALEAENRRLTRQVPMPDVVDVRQNLLRRLDQIDARLAQLEGVVHEVLTRLTPLGRSATVR